MSNKHIDFGESHRSKSMMLSSTKNGFGAGVYSPKHSRSKHILSKDLRKRSIVGLHSQKIEEKG